MQVQLIDKKGSYLSSVEWDGKSPIGQYVAIGDPSTVPAYYANGGWVQGEPGDFDIGDTVPPIVSKTRFLDLLGDGAVKFQFALLSTKDKMVLAQLKVAETHLNSATEIELDSEKVIKFVELLKASGIIDDVRASKILNNEI